MIDLAELKTRFPYLTNITPVSGRSGQKLVFTGQMSGSSIALKVIYEDSEERAAREVAAQEKLAAIMAMRSPYVPKIIQFDKVKLGGVERLFIIEEFVDGSSLRTLMDKATLLTVPTAISLAKSLLLACGDFEKASIVHRDIKPENLIIAPDGHLWVIDFGLVRHLDMRSLTGDGSYRWAGGTPGYCAPEQFQNRKAEIRITADFFSIGVILYEGLSGRNPYYERVKTPLEVLRLTETLDLPKLGIPGDRKGAFSAFISAMTQRFPMRRPQTSNEALGWLLDTENTLQG